MVRMKDGSVARKRGFESASSMHKRLPNEIGYGLDASLNSGPSSSFIRIGSNRSQGSFQTTSTTGFQKASGKPIHADDELGSTSKRMFLFGKTGPRPSFLENRVSAAKSNYPLVSGNHHTIPDLSLEKREMCYEKMLVQLKSQSQEENMDSPFWREKDGSPIPMTDRMYAPFERKINILGPYSLLRQHLWKENVI